MGEEEKEGWLPFDMSEAGQKVRKFLTKKRLLVILAIASAIPAVWGTYQVLSGILAAGHINVIAPQPMVVSWNLTGPTTMIQGQNYTITVSLNNPSPNPTITGKWVFQIDADNILASDVTLYVQPPNGVFVEMTSKIVSSGSLFIESSAYNFAPGTTTWNFKIRFNKATSYNQVKAAVVQPASTPPFP